MRTSSISSGAPNVLVVGVDQKTMGLIRECLGTEAVLPAASVGYGETLEEAHLSRPSVIIVGMEGEGFDEAVRLGPMVHQDLGPHVVMVAIASKADPNGIRSAMRAGYREFVVLPEDGPLLRQAVRDSGTVGSVSEDQGEVIAVVGTKGGIGVSMLAVNLGAELGAVQRVCVVDLNFDMGDCASILDLSPKQSIHDIINNLDRLDERMLAGTVGVHPSGVHVVSQPNELVEGMVVREEEVIRVLSATADAYNYVIADCGMRLDQASLTTTAVSDLVLLVVEPNVLSVKNCFRRLQLMTRTGIEKDAIRLVVNKWDKNAPVGLKDIERNLNIPVACTIARDDVTCTTALDAGKLVRDVKRGSQVATDISAAVELVTEKAQRVETQGGGSLLGKIFK